jgi:hypothetical protein
MLLKLSKRQENPPVIRTTQQRNSLEQQQGWQNAQDSRSHLPSPQEGAEDDGLDPYLVTDPEQEHSGIVHGHNQQATIRPVQTESESPIHIQPEDREQYHSHQHQHSLSLTQQQQFEAPPQPQNYYQPQGQHPDSLGIIHPQYRQQNPETVSQLSYESPIDQREEPQQRPVSVQSNGHSPTGPPRQEYPNRTTSIQGPQGPRPLSQYTVMAPPTGASQPNRRSADPKQTLQGNQGPPDSRDGPPPGYRQGQFPAGSTPTAGPGQSPIPPVVGNQGPNYRGGPPQREQYGPSGGGEQGRSTPPPAPGERDVNDAYKELRKLDREIEFKRY